MAEYIEREALLEDMATTVLPRDAQHLYLAMRGKVRNAPTADVVEVVRCKDCIYSFMSITGETVLYCDMYPSDDHLCWDKNHYCSYGEKKPKETVSLVDGHIDKSNKCVSCGADIPEGTWTCPICDKRWE